MNTKCTTHPEARPTTTAAARGSAPAVRAVLAAAAAVLLALAALTAAPAAFAHDSLIESTPKSGTELAEAPDSATLRFSGELKAIGNEVRLTATDGTEVDATSSVQRDTMTVDFGGELPAGGYTLVWRVVSSDGHPIEGSAANGQAIEFTVAGAPEASATASPTASPTAGAAASGTAGAPATQAPATGAPAQDASDAAQDEQQSGAEQAAETSGMSPLAIWLILAAAAIAAAAVVIAKVRRQSGK